MSLQAINPFQTTDGDEVIDYCTALCERGLIGGLAVCLFRTQNNSSRAKRNHRSRSSRYENKNGQILTLCRFLERFAEGLAVDWGWREDDQQAYHRQVLYVDTPEGQVSFHTADRLQGPDYEKPWCQKRPSEDRLLGLFAEILRSEPTEFICVPFGKYAGLPCSLVPDHYLDWMQERKVQPELLPRIIQARETCHQFA